MDRCKGTMHVFIETDGFGSTPRCVCGLRENDAYLAKHRKKPWWKVKLGELRARRARYSWLRRTACPKHGKKWIHPELEICHRCEQEAARG